MSVAHELRPATTNDGPQGRPRKRSVEPIYRKIATELEDQIERGQYPVGTNLPSETDLVRHYNVSRFTVREALRELQKLGLISRHRGSGTMVEARAPDDCFHQQLTLYDEPLRHADTFDITDKVSRLVASRTNAQELGGRVGDVWLRVERISHEKASDGGPRLTMALMPDTFAAALSEANPYAEPLARRIERLFSVRVERVHVELQTMRFNAERCRQLGLQTGTVGLAITRRFVDSSGKVLLVIQCACANERYVTRLAFVRSNLGRDEAR
jgi:DNA-binding GntR family transcriptional regulator